MTEQNAISSIYRANFHLVKHQSGELDPDSLRLFSQQEHPVQIKTMHITLDDWSVSGRDTILKFIRGHPNLKMVEVSLGESAFLNEICQTPDFQFASWIADAVCDNPTVQDLQLVLHLTDNTLHDASKLLNACSRALTQLKIVFELQPTKSFHDSLIELATQIAVQSASGLRCLHVFDRYLGHGQLAAHISWHSYLSDIPHNDNGLTLAQLGVFLASCAPNYLEQIVIDGPWALDTCTVQTNKLISVLNTNPNLYDLSLTSFKMNQDSMHLLANYLTSSDCSLRMICLKLQQREQIFSNILIPALASNTTVSTLELDVGNMTGPTLSEMIRDLLVTNKALTVLKVLMPIAHRGEMCSVALAQAFGRNQTLRTLELKGDCTNYFIDFLSVGKALKQTERICGIEELKLNGRIASRQADNKEILSLLGSLPRQLKSLRLSYNLDCVGLFGDFLQAIQKNKTLRKIDVGFILNGSVKDLAAAVQSNNSLTHLAFTMPTSSLDNTETNQLQAELQPLLKAMNGNLSLESLDIGGGGWVNASLQNKLQQICVQNRVHKVAKAIDNGSLTTNIAPNVLHSIQTSCAKHNASLGFLHGSTASILHSMLKQSPRTAAMQAIFEHLRQCRSKEEKGSTNINSPQETS